MALRGAGSAGSRTRLVPSAAPFPWAAAADPGCAGAAFDQLRTGLNIASPIQGRH